MYIRIADWTLYAKKVYVQFILVEIYYNHFFAEELVTFAAKIVTFIAVLVTFTSELSHFCSKDSHFWSRDSHFCSRIIHNCIRISHVWDIDSHFCCTRLSFTDVNVEIDFVVFVQSLSVVTAAAAVYT